MPLSDPLRRVAAASMLALALAASGCAYFARQLPDDPPGPSAQDPGPVPGPGTAVKTSEVWRMPPDPAEAEGGLRALLLRARDEGLPVAIAGARQSGGGQAYAAGGLIIDMRPYRGMALDAKARTLKVQAGATWKEVLPFLHARGFSPLVMQAYNDFTVGGSLSVNAHGLQPAAPISHAVLAFRIMLADGRVVKCSRSERSELFKLALGGYGLFGVILDADLRVVPNERYRVQRHFVRPEQFAQAFASHVGRDAGLAHGRFSVAPGTFLREGILTVYTRLPGRPSAAPLPAADPVAAVQRRYLRDAIGSAGGKLAYWEAEKRADTGLRQDFTTRNQLLNGCAESLESPEVPGTAARQTYFVPRRHLGAFVEYVRQLMPGDKVDLLEASVAAVGADHETLLRYADQDMFALTLVFHQRGNEADEQALKFLNQQLVDAALSLKGRHFLPYRLHATAKQFQQAYPAASRFFDAKRRYDPDERFQNQLYLKYAKGP
jgi:FAD/FMN-containing dehydrogenase